MKYLSKDYRIINIRESEFEIIKIDKNGNDFDVYDDSIGVIESFDTNEEARMFIRWLILCLDGRTHMLYGDFLGYKDEGNK